MLIAGLVDEVDPHRVADLTIDDHEGGSGVPEDVGLERRALRECQDRPDQPQGCDAPVEKQAGPANMLRLSLETVERVVADQPFRPPYLVHDLVAGVDARGAPDAFHLQAVADVDTRWADDDAALAIDAVAVFGVARLASWLAAVPVITNYHGVAVGQRRLQAAVGADDQAHLFAEPAEVEVEDTRHHDDPCECRRVLGWAPLHHVQHGRKRHEVADEDVRQQERQHHVERMLEQLAPQFVEREPRRVASQSLGSRPFDPALHASKDPFEKDGVRTSVATPQTAFDCRHDQEDERDSAQ